MAANKNRVVAEVLAGLLAVLAFTIPSHAQTSSSRLGERRGGSVTFEPIGSGVLFDALDPTVKRWYVPQELYQEYRWKTWEYSNYARSPYQRYVNTALEGGYFYDIYGNFVTRGWLIYDWRQDVLTPLGSSIYQDPNYSNWFSRLIVASDSKGGAFYAVTIGDQIRTTLTPMTFSKPLFNGIQLDLASDKYAATMLFSRLSSPQVGGRRDPERRTNITNLVGGRTTVQVGDFVTVGATYLNAHHSRTTLGSFFSSSSFKGTLGEGQASLPVTAIALVLSDDSPEDGEGGAALFEYDVIAVHEDFQTGVRQDLRLESLTNDPTRWPIIEGGFQEEGFLSASGLQKIIISYDFTDPAYIGPDPTEIVKVTFDLVLANDYRVQVWSDRQTGRAALPQAPLTREVLDEGEPVLFDMARAPDNVKDGSNQRRVVFDYGLPTAHQIYGFTLEARDIAGFDLYAEYDVNHRFRQYPNLALFNAERDFEDASFRADAWMVNLSYLAFPWFFFGEAFSMAREYSTSPFTVDTSGDITYDNPTMFFYEFVDDNDDQDRFPDWSRPNQPGSDRQVFPGWDENNDFVSDFNQNDNETISNRLPDYEEPFLRYGVDRPEFLFGIDLNNNAWIDRFENDEEPDFPYKRDHLGYNVYGGAELAPGVRLSVGRTSQELMSAARDNATTYGLFTLDRDYANIGRLRFFNMLKKTQDDIPDDRFEPTPFLKAGLPGRVVDLLPAQDTWIYTLWFGLAYTQISDLNVHNKVKYEGFLQQADDPRDLDGNPLRDNSTFFGLINKADYTYRLGELFIRPQAKSEFLRQTPFLQREDKRKQWTGLLSLLAQFPVMQKSSLQAGVEYMRLSDLATDEDELEDRGTLGPTGDLNELSLALQWSTVTDYLGYKLTLQTGFKLTRRSVEVIAGVNDRIVKASDSETNNATFITVYSGIE